MRLPFSKPYRAFSEFDSFSEEECRRYARELRIHRPFLVVVMPRLATVLVAIAWTIGWPLAVDHLPVNRFIPLPESHDGRLLMLLISTIIAAAFAGFLLRDIFLWLGFREEVRGASCPKCRQSLLGVPVQSIGTEPDPAKRFVRCPECGRKFVLLDIGITPRDLIPFEQRSVSPDFGRKRIRPDGYTGAAR